VPIKKEDQVLDFAFAKRGIDDFFRDYPSRHIRFYSIGEPTLEFELLKRIRDYAYQQAGDQLKVELQTNGVFTKEIAKWIAKYVDILWISCDGPAYIQDSQRPTPEGKGSSEIVESNLKYFRDIPKIQFGVRTTLAASVIKRQSELLDYFENLGIKYINVHPACVSVESDRDESLFKWDPIEFAECFWVTHQEARRRGIFYNCLYIANFDEKTRLACRSCVPYPQLTTDGYVSCCDYGQFGPQYSPGALQQLIYGKYIPEEDVIIYDEEKIHKIRSRCVENLRNGPCKDCECLYYCAGGCMGETVNATGNLMGVHEINCAIIKHLAKKMHVGSLSLFPVIHS
jgi:radical SAM protein with 4Fe4S-binding SPASM domain